MKFHEPELKQYAIPANQDVALDARPAHMKFIMTFRDAVVILSQLEGVPSP